MFTYYVQLGWRSLKRNPIITVLMVSAIALGIAASMTTLTVMHMMGSDPIPWKSSRLHYVQLDNWNPDQPFYEDGRPPDQVTYRDALALMGSTAADKQTAMFTVALPVQPDNKEVKPFQAIGRVTQTGFFSMFEPPFKYGDPWPHEDDSNHARAVVLGKEMNEKLFGGQNSVGKTVRIDGIDYLVSGVLDDWKLRFRYYDLTTGAFENSEDFFLPFLTGVDLHQHPSGSTRCWKTPADGWEAFLDSECVWIQVWVELDSAPRLAEYRSFLNNYVAEQKKVGRFQRPVNNRLLDVNQWIRDQKVVPADVEVQTGLAFAFLAVCLVNTIGLLLAKFTRKSGEIGLRRALGASRGNVFAQYLVESGVVGLTGGLLGLLLTGLGLIAVRSLYPEYRTAAHLDWVMVGMTVLLAVIAALMAGLYPAWRACRGQAGTQLKV